MNSRGQKMKSTIRTGIYITLAASLVLSCASTPKSTEIANQPEESIQEEVLPPPPTEAELYAQKLATTHIELIASPKETTKGKIFASPYQLTVKDTDGKPLGSVEISVTYPAKRENGLVVFSQTVITSDAEGKASFLPPVPEYAFNSEVSFTPNGDFSNPEIAALSQSYTAEHALKAPFKVQTNLKSAGGVIALVDFNQNGNAITSNPVSSSNLLMTLMKLGFTRIGNIDLTSQVVVGDDTKIFNRAKSIVGNTSQYLVYGTIKIDSTEKTDAGISYTLTGIVKAMSLQTSEVTFALEKTVTVTDKNDWNALANARKTLADEIANEIKYGI